MSDTFEPNPFIWSEASLTKSHPYPTLTGLQNLSIISCCKGSKQLNFWSLKINFHIFPHSQSYLTNSCNISLSALTLTISYWTPMALDTTFCCENREKQAQLGVPHFEIQVELNSESKFEPSVVISKLMGNIYQKFKVSILNWKFLVNPNYNYKSQSCQNLTKLNLKVFSLERLWTLNLEIA